MSHVTTPHFSLPFRVVGSGVAVNEQDTIDEITDCVRAILLCPLGYRIEAPDFGLRDQAFLQGGVDEAEIEATLDRLEPRAAHLIEEDDSQLADLISNVTVEVRGAA